VLVIEDEADIRQLLRALLEREGFTVSEAGEGRDGVRQFHQKHPDIVILDVGLPELDGWQVLERIRDMSDVPVLMLTALGTERDKVRGLNAGADDYLTKPFSRVELLAREAVREGLQNDPDVVETVKKVLAQKALQQALEKNAPQPTDDEVKAWYDSHQQPSGDWLYEIADELVDPLKRAFGI